MDKIEKIGKVTLDYTFYSGQDLYSDGPIEDELLQTAKCYNEEELENIINVKNDWAHLYHFSQIRRNIVNWIPMKKTDKVLEIGSGCGAISGALAEKAGKIDCVELSKKRSLINANRNRNCDGITIKLGNFEEIEPHLDNDYDVITLIGVWEYAGIYLSAEDPFHRFLQLLKKHLKSNGKLIIAIENRYGLKYWAGCREDHTVKFFEGLEGYTMSNGAVTFGKNEMEKMFEETGYAFQFYYPYPDYKLPLQIFSDDYLPKQGQLRDNGKNLDNSRIVLFDEGKVYDSLIQDGMFPYFSNSFLVILQPDKIQENEKVLYSKYSNERRDEFRIRTDIIKKSNGERIVKKSPMSKKAIGHIKKMEKMYKLLSDNWEKNAVLFNKYMETEDGIEFEYIQGKHLGEEIKQMLNEGKRNNAIEKICTFFDVIIRAAKEDFEETEEFKKVFGRCPLKGVKAIDGADIDLILENIIYRDGKWNILDYEWSYNFPIPVNYILYRSLEHQAPDEIKQLKLCDKYGISEEEKLIYKSMEEHFMREYVYENQILLADSPIIKPKICINGEMIQKEIEKCNIKVYYDCGQGFSENNIRYFSYEKPEDIYIEIPIEKNVRSIRIDPMEKPGIIYIDKLEAEKKSESHGLKYYTNGLEIEKNAFVFETSDPWITIVGNLDHIDGIKVNLSLDSLSCRVITEITNLYRTKKLKNKFKRIYNAVRYRKKK